MTDVRAPINFLRDGKESVEEGVVIVKGLNFGLKGVEIYPPVDELAEIEVSQALEKVLLVLVCGLSSEVILFAFPC